MPKPSSLAASKNAAPSSTPSTPSAGDNLVKRIDDVSNVIGTLIPAVSAIGSMVRLVTAALRPTEAQAAQLFDDAIAEFDSKVAGLHAAIDGFEKAKQDAAAKTQG